MEKQIQELTDKLYKEGVEKGNAQAEIIIAEARQTAGKIVMQAKAEAEALCAAAKKQNEELKQNTMSELKLTAGQTIEAAKASLTDCVTNTVCSEAVKAAMADTKFMQEMILKLVAEWSSKEELIISTEDAAALQAFFAQKAKEVLDRGVKIEEVNGMKHSFSVAPADGSYKIVFGETEFEELFKDFLRPALIDMLYK